MAKFTAWAEQTFLNPPDSSSSGWTKFSIDRNYFKNVSVTMTMADCYKQIDLEFFLNFPKILDNDSQKKKRKKINDAYRSLLRRRQKADRLRRTMERFFNHLEAAYMSYEKDLDKLAQKHGFEVVDAD